MPIFLNRLGRSLVPHRAATLLVALIVIAVVSSCGRSEKSLNRKIDAAILTHDLSGIKELVHDNPNLVFHRDESGETPLHLAASFSEKDVAEFLLANGADVNARTNRGDTPLDAALSSRHEDLADFLRQHGGQ